MSAEGMEERPGPSRHGYCGYCSIIYTSLDQHVSSAAHRDRVRLSSRSSSLSSLMERFLQDVLLHHPHRYADTRVSQEDPPSPPSPGSPPVPRLQVAELGVSDDDGRSVGTSEDLTSCLLVHPEEVDVVKTTATHSQSERLLFGEAVLDGSSLPITEPDTRQSPKDTPLPHSPGEDTPLSHSPGEDTLLPHSPGEDTLLPLPPGVDPPFPHSPGEDTPLPHSPGEDTPLPLPPVAAPSSVHRKCHRKTDRRRKPSSSSSSSFYAPLLCSTPLPGPSPLHGPSHMPGSAPLALGRVSGCSSPSPLKGETESFYFSLSASQRTGESDSWDAPVQAALESRALRPQVNSPPTQLGQSEAWKLTCLTESHVKMDDQVYARQLDSALRTLPADSGWSQPLHSALRTLPAEGGRGRQAGYRCLPIEEVRPRPPYIPESFRGKSLAQIECEDEQKVESLVQQFRHSAFLCYFHTEPLARYGRRSLAKGRRDQSPEVESENAAQLLPLLDHHDDEAPSCTRKRKRRAFRLASRCQVVKVSHGTQTTPLVVPAVCQPALPRPPLPLEEQPANQQPAESPEEEEGRLPPCYSALLRPLQPGSSLLLLLRPPGHAPPATPARPAGPASKRCRRRSRPLEAEGLKVRYKRLPVRWYDPAARRVLGSRPRRLPPRGNTVARQLFRSLSPDLNAHGRGRKRRRKRRREEEEEEEEDGATAVKVQRSSDQTPTYGRFLLGTLRTEHRTSRGRGRRKGGRSQTPGRGRGRRREGGEASSRPGPGRRGGRAGEPRKVPGSDGPLEASARSLRVRRRTGCPCCT